MIDLVNLAESMDEDDLRKIGETCIQEFEADEESRSEWLEMNAKWIELYRQIDYPVNEPWEGASEESVPMLAEAVNQFHARAYKAMFPSRNIVKAIPTGDVDQETIARADRVSKHMNWQLMTRDRGYKRDKDILIHSAALHGCHFTKTYPDFSSRGAYRPKVENVRAEDLVFPYGIGPKSIDQIERKTQILWMSVERTQHLAAKGYFLEAAEKAMQDDDRPTTRAADEADGRQPSYDYGAMNIAKVLEQHRTLDLDEDGLPEPYIVWIDATSRKVLRIAARYTIKDGETVPIEYFTQYDFLRNPDGTYGLGMGHLLGKLNTAVNKLLRQTVDAGELSTAGNMSGFISERVGMPGDEIELQMGKFTKVRNSGDDLSRAFFQPKFAGPNPTIGSVIQLLMARGDRLATTTEAITGQTNAVMQPSTLLSLIDQSLQIFSTVIGRLLEAMGDELQKVYRLNGEYLDQREYFSVLDAGGTPVSAAVMKSDYADDLQVEPVADPNQATEQQKLTRAQAEYQFALTNPLTAQNPTALYEASRRYLEAIGTKDIDKMLPPPQQQEPERVDDPMVENAGALLPTPQIPPVHADQNHLQHIQAHMTLMNDPEYGPALTPEGQKALQAHIQTHTSLMYLITETDALDDAPGPLGTGTDEADGGRPMAAGMAGPGAGGGMARPQGGQRAVGSLPAPGPRAVAG